VKGEDVEGGMPVEWWVLEIAVTALLVAIVLVLGPLIKRFGKSYAADVFRHNPRTGKSYLVLMDVAYYLVFTAYILFTLTFSPPRAWEQVVTATQVQDQVVRVGGMLLLMGILHGLNVLSLPVIGRLLGLGREFAQSAVPDPTQPGSDVGREPR
jgi:hypothetical protein